MAENDQNAQNNLNDQNAQNQAPETREQQERAHKEMERRREWAVGQVIGTELGTANGGKMTASGARRFNDFVREIGGIRKELRKRVIDPASSENYRDLKPEDIDALTNEEIEKIFEPYRTKIESRRNAIEAAVAHAYRLDDRERKALAEHIGRVSEADLELLDAKTPEDRDRYLAENKLVSNIESRGPKSDQIVEGFGIIDPKDQEKMSPEDVKLLKDIGKP